MEQWTTTTPKRRSEKFLQREEKNHMRTKTNLRLHCEPGKKREKIAGRKHFGWAKNLVGTFQWVQSGVGLRGGESGQAGGNGNEKMKNPKRKSK